MKYIVNLLGALCFALSPCLSFSGQGMGPGPGVGVSASSPIFACDDFTEPVIITNIALSAHTPTTYSGCSVAGFTWVSVTASNRISVTKQLETVGGGRDWAVQTGGTAPSSANYFSQAEFTTSSNTKNSPYISVRWLATGSTDTGYLVEYRGGTWEVYRSDGGNSQTQICTTAGGQAAPTATVIKFAVSGTGATVSLTVTRSGTDILGGTSGIACDDTSGSRIVSTGRPGAGGFFSDGTGQYIGNWQASN